jgi:hypothetical protein
MCGVSPVAPVSYSLQLLSARVSVQTLTEHGLKREGRRAGALLKHFRLNNFAPAPQAFAACRASERGPSAPSALAPNVRVLLKARRSRP